MDNIKNKISLPSKIMLILASAALFYSIWVPIWGIELDAPQYPEGLKLLIYADRLGGNVDIINGLNHYIGMKTLHTDDFIEFTLLPYIIGFFAAISLIVSLFGKRKHLNILFTIFLLFGILSMVDFWRWEYDYGHDLNPEAAIIVPGMAYQPPLIGFKQLLNFGAYSMPELGGWLFISSGLLMLICVFIEDKKNKLLNLKSNSIAMILFSFFLISCGKHQPKDIKLNIDNCQYCQMTIADMRFGSELLSDKGRVYIFDDVSCMVRYMNEHKDMKFSGYYVSDYLQPNGLINTEQSFFIKGEGIGSPMGGNIAAFSNEDSAKIYQERLNAKSIDWHQIKQ